MHAAGVEGIGIMADATLETYDDLWHFEAYEFDYPTHMQQDFLQLLDEVREEAGTPFHITSDFRPNDPNAHGLGRAVDIACANSVKRMKIVRAAIACGVTRIGVYDKHIHLDNAPQPKPQEVMWWGTSR